MSEVNANRRIAKNTVFLYIRMLFVMIVTFYTTRVVLSVLGVIDYGIYNVVCGFVSMFSVFNTSLTTGTNRFYNYSIGKGEVDGVKKVYNVAIRIQLVLVAFTLILLEVVGLWYINYKMQIPIERLNVANWIFQFSVFSLVMLLFQTPYSAAVLAYEKMNYYALVSIIDILLKLLFVILLQYINYDKLFFYGLLMVLVSIVNFMLYFLYTRHNFKEIRYQHSFDKPLFKSLLSFSCWSLLDPITSMCKFQGSNMVLNAFFGPIVNAAYGVSTQISGAIDSFTGNISVSFRPQIIQSYSSKNYLRMKKLMYSLSKINYTLHFMLVVPAVLEVHYLLRLWLGDSCPEYAYSFSSFIMIIATLNCLHAPISMVMVASGKIKKIKIMSLVVISSVIPIGYVGFRLGFAPISIFIILLFLTLINIIWSIRIMCQTISNFRASEYVVEVVLKCVRFSLLVIPLPLVLFFVLPSSFIRLLLVCISSVLVSLIVGYLCVIDESEKVLIKSLLSSFFQRFK